MTTLRLPILLAAALAIFGTTAQAQSIPERDGWRVIETGKDYATLLADLKAAVAAEKMGVVTEAGPTEMAASRGETIPGNRVVGVFRNDFAVSIIRVAPAAMIEAPIRIMVMAEESGSATLAYKVPSYVFAPYAEQGGATLSDVAAELDAIFTRIAEAAASEGP